APWPTRREHPAPPVSLPSAATASRRWPAPWCPRRRASPLASSREIAERPTRCSRPGTAASRGPASWPPIFPVRRRTRPAAAFPRSPRSSSAAPTTTGSTASPPSRASCFGSFYVDEIGRATTPEASGTRARVRHGRLESRIEADLLQLALHHPRHLPDA